MSTTDPTEPQAPRDPETAAAAPETIEAEVVETEVVEVAPDGETVVEETVIVAEPAPPLIEPEPAPPAAPPAPAYPVEEEVVVAEVVDEPAYVPPAAPVPPPAAPQAPAPPYGGPAQPQVVYVQPVAPPKKVGNRGLGSLLALGAAVVFAALLAGGTWVIGYVQTRSTGFEFLAVGEFWIPVVLFAIAFVLLVLLANRASWWAYILGSLFVAAGVYFGTIGVALLLDPLLGADADRSFASAAVSPFVILAALVAREVSMWFGSILARRGRKLKVRNADARAAYEREAAERRAATGY